MDKRWCVRIRVIVVLVFFAFLLMHAARTVKVWKDRGFHENNDVGTRALVLGTLLFNEIK
jgi:hypothetical protein